METLQKGIEQAENDQERLVVEKNIEATMLMFTGEFQQLGSDELQTLDRATATARKDELRYRAKFIIAFQCRRVVGSSRFWVGRLPCYRHSGDSSRASFCASCQF